MDTVEKGSDLLSKRICAMSGLILALASVGLHAYLVIPVSIALVFMLRKLWRNKPGLTKVRPPFIIRNP
ncbi:hypothetical protein C0K24_18630 [Salmonella enterica]|nr:hypothetical protein [Salmonella enterica]